jgi:hypothetical protein
MHLRRAALAAAIFAFLAPATALAQGGPTKFIVDNFGKYGQPYAPIVLLLPAGPRTLAMGNTSIVGRDDDVLFFNPAQLVIARGFSASYERYSATAQGGSLSAVTRFSTGGIAVGMKTVNYEMPADVFPANRGSMLLDGPALGTSLEASIGMGQLIKGHRLGVAVKYVEDNVPANRVSHAAVDLGVSRDFLRFYTLGLAVQNIGPSTDVPCSDRPQSLTNCVIPPTPPGANFELFTPAHMPLKTTLGVGTQRPLGELDVAATAAVSMIRTSFVSPSGGVEVGYSWLDGYSVALRAGARRPFPGETPFTAGAGFNVDRLSIDYAVEALRSTQFFVSSASQVSTHVAHRIGLRIR